MAKFLIIIEDADPRNPDGPVDVQVHQFARIGEDLAMPTKAGKMTRYAQLKLFEMEMIADKERQQAEGLRTEEAARCWH